MNEDLGLDEFYSIEYGLPIASVVAAAVIALVVGENAVHRVGVTSLMFVIHWSCIGLSAHLEEWVRKIVDLEAEDTPAHHVVAALIPPGIYYVSLIAVPLSAVLPLVRRML